jgi:heme/copper-type cytochrome/quinol oxidase subunit 2
VDRTARGLVLMRLWPHDNDPTPEKQAEWKVMLEAWMLGIPMVLMLVLAIWSLF